MDNGVGKRKTEMKQFRYDNTEGYSGEELEILNEAFEAVIEAEGLAAEPDFDDERMPSRAAHELSDQRQYIGEQIEAAWMPGRSVAEVVAQFNRARDEYRALMVERGELDGWWAFTAYNTETLYGWGDKDEAEKIADILNEGRETNLYFPEPLTDSEQLARMNDSSGFNMNDELIEHANRYDEVN